MQIVNKIEALLNCLPGKNDECYGAWTSGETPVPIMDMLEFITSAAPEHIKDYEITAIRYAFIPPGQNEGEALATNGATSIKVFYKVEA